MYGWLNILSLILGLGSWIFPLVAIFRRKSGPLTAAGSFGMCSMSLACQIFYTQHLVTIRDWSAIEDTHGAVAFAAAVLLIVTLVLNGITNLRKEK